MKKTGIFLGFQPGDNISIHGIGRLLAFMLKERKMTTNDDIVLFCPAWLTESLNLLLKDNKITEDRFEIVTTSSIPYGVKMKNYWSNRKKAKREVSRIRQFFSKYIYKTKNLTKSLLADLFSTSSWLMFIMKIFCYALVALISSPFLIIVSILYAFCRLIKFTKRKLLGFFKRPSPQLKSIKSLIIKGRGIIYQAVLDNEMNKLVKLVNNRKDVKVCFIPSMTWSQIKNLNCKKVLAAPDIVFYDFPTQFPGVINIHKRIRISISSADHLITYSEHVKRQHLMDKCGVEPKKITVIKHANIDMNPYLSVPKAIKGYLTPSENAQQIVKRHIHSKYGPGHVLYNCDLEKLDCLIYSSQYRSHKNIFNLIKAIKIINRDMHHSVKLILTGDITNVNYLQDYIKLNYLENDVIVMHNISSEMLAAINRLSKCSVNPTLFEGGFPFTFSEAYSVGTPSVMSDIKVVSSEIEDPNLRNLMLFDPYNPYSIAKKVIWALENTQDLYFAQADLYGKFNRRDWKVVANEYNQVFNEIIV
ncbi:Glycosyl transferases group 1 [compost metagenome]